MKRPTMKAGSLVRRLRGSLRSDAFDRQMHAELQHHLALETEALIRRGMDPAAARAAAQRSFGSVAQVEDECRDSWGVRTIDALRQDVGYGVRNLLKYPAYTGIVLLTLALGIGANTAIFSVVHAVLLRSLPYTHGDRLIELRQQATKIGVTNAGLSPKDMADYRAQTASLEDLVEYHQMSFNLLSMGDASRVQTGVVSAHFFDVIGVKPILGRTFRSEDDVKDAPAVLILGYSYWQSMFGGDAHVIGRTVDMNDRVHTIVGVLPQVPQYPAENDVYMPTSACPFRSSAGVVEGRSQGRMVQAIGLLKPGVTLERARGDLDVVVRRLQATYPQDYDTTLGFGATALSVREELTRQARPTLLVLFATTSFVLLLVCANVANLTLARLVGRDRELAVRAALGAGRGRIARQLITESTMLALAGGAFGLLLAALARTLLVTFTARFTSRAAEIGVDRAVLLFALGASLVTGLLFGLVPAFSRRTLLWSGIKDGQRAATSQRLSARNALVVAQVAISFMLLIAAGLMVRSFIKLEQVDAGFNADHVLTMQVTLDFVKYNDAPTRRSFFGPLLDKVRNEPGVKSAALSIKFPLDQQPQFNGGFQIEGHPPPDGQARPRADFRLASPDYFRTIGMTVLAGRPFADTDDTEAPPVAIVNLSMARHHFAGIDPIGRRVLIRLGSPPKDVPHTIVGVVNDVKQYGLNTDSTDELYRPFAQGGPLGATLLVRTAGDPRSMIRAMQGIVRSVDPKQPVSRIQTLEDARNKTLTSPRLTMVLVTLFALVALIITAAGIAGVVSFSVSQRTTEIGVRMALGARRTDVVAMVLRQGLTPVAIGLAAGVAGAVLTTGMLTKLLFAVEPTDAPTFTVVIGVLAAVAALACLAPARRAASIEPMRALRAS